MIVSVFVADRRRQEVFERETDRGSFTHLKHEVILDTPIVIARQLVAFRVPK